MTSPSQPSAQGTRGSWMGGEGGRNHRTSGGSGQMPSARSRDLSSGEGAPRVAASLGQPCTCPDRAQEELGGLWRCCLHG